MRRKDPAEEVIQIINQAKTDAREQFRSLERQHNSTRLEDISPEMSIFDKKSIAQSKLPSITASKTGEDLKLSKSVV